MPGPNADKRFRVPDEDIRLTQEEVEVIQTRQFQRLFDLKQLGLAYLVYPMATHTRGAHSIQCVGQAARILRAVNRENDPSAAAVRMAALLHDISHIPFSHTLEDENLVLDRHDRPKRVRAAFDILKAELAQRGKTDLRSRAITLIDEAWPILEGIGTSAATTDWRSDLVGNTICADLLAYITTDAAWTGIEKRPGYYRLYDYFEVSNNNRLCIRLTKGGLRPDIVSAILDLLDMRYALTERVYMHHAKAVASATLARATRLLGVNYSDVLLGMGDETFIAHLESIAKDQAVHAATRLLASIRSRRLYKRIFRLGPEARNRWDQGRDPGAFCKRWRDPIEVEAMLQEIENRHRLPTGSLVLWCPDVNANMKLANVQVVWDSSASTQRDPVPLRDPEVRRRFRGIHDRVMSIEDQYADLWTFWIAIDPAMIESAAAVIASLQEAIGETCDPDFVETYLKRKIFGFDDAQLLNTRVRAVTAKLESGAQRALRQDAARMGSAAPPLSEDEIRSVIKEQIDAGDRLPLLGEEPQ